MKLLSLEKIFFSIIFLPLIFLIAIIRPFKLIRFGQLQTERIGMISRTEHYLIHEKQKLNNNVFDIWIPNQEICNIQLLKMLKRNLFIFSNGYILLKLIEKISKYLNFFSIHLIKPYIGPARLDRGKCVIRLTKEEIDKGNKMLKKFRIPKNAKIICFSVRDNMYLKKKFPNKNFSYHLYRNSSVKNFLPTIKFLIKKNFYVVRMGQISAEKVNFKHKKFIDYPFNNNKSDFMDFFFAYKCYFWICGCTGIDEIAHTFRKPLIDLNMVPISGLKVTSKKTLLCAKIHKTSTNSKLGLKKIFKKKLDTIDMSKKFKMNKVNVHELSQKQVKEIVIEMINLMKVSWKIKNKNDLESQKKFKKILYENLYKKNFEYKFNAVYSNYFLKKNNWFLK